MRLKTSRVTAETQTHTQLNSTDNLADLVWQFFSLDCFFFQDSQITNEYSNNKSLFTYFQLSSMTHHYTLSRIFERTNILAHSRNTIIVGFQFGHLQAISIGVITLLAPIGRFMALIEKMIQIVCDFQFKCFGSSASYIFSD